MKFLDICNMLRTEPKQWFVTGAAGFIGSNVTEFLLQLNQRVIAFDNFSTGHRHNLEDVQKSVAEKASLLTIVEGDITNLLSVQKHLGKSDYVLHQAAYGSVPKSIENPIEWNRINVDGFLNVITAARDAQAKGFVYASSSSVYGDSPDLPKVENRIGIPLSPYAVSKYVNELYGEVFSRCYGFSSTGLRYFNVFGPRQDPEGAYAAVVPKWITTLASGGQCVINGDGKTSRDFCYIKNVIQANILAAVSAPNGAVHRAYNVGVSEQTDLTTLHDLISEAVGAIKGITTQKPMYQDFRAGDIRHSLADISAIKKDLGYEPTHTIREGMKECIEWYLNLRNN